MTHHWKKCLFKMADLVFTLPVSHCPCVWPFVMYEPLVIGVALPSPHLPLGLAGKPAPFWTWKGSCMVCGHLYKGMNGLFCRNYYGTQGWWGAVFEVCSRVWCGSCYTPHPSDTFHINIPSDESGFQWWVRVKPKDALRFHQACDGDHLMMPFQCYWCLFRMLIGPFPKLDVFGVTVAIGMLLKSLQPGRYQSCSQFETMRKLHSAYSNFCLASAQGAMAMMTLGRDTLKTFLSTCPMQSVDDTNPVALFFSAL